MEDLIKSLQILLKYGNPKHPTHCEHDCLFVVIDPSLVSDPDIIELNKLGFCEGDGGFNSYRYGSC